MSDFQSPHDNLVRATRIGCELRESSDDGMPTLHGHFLKFNRWTEIDSWFEGRFMERIAPGALKKTISENRNRIKALFQHGRDPQIGDKPLGPVDELREDDQGGYYEVPLLDTSYNRDLVPGLKAGLYGASFAFKIMREDRDESPGKSDHNPDGIAERTIKELRLYEFGPVTFPAYADATAGVRSLTDEIVFADIARDPQRFRELLAIDLSALTRDEDHVAPVDPDAGASQDASTSDQARRASRDYLNREEAPSWQL